MSDFPDGRIRYVLRGINNNRYWKGPGINGAENWPLHKSDARKFRFKSEADHARMNTQGIGPCTVEEFFGV